MDKDFLSATAKRLTNPPKGILAIDESIGTCTKRFEKLGVASTEETRRQYREMLVTAPEIENYISGYILFDETLKQSTVDGRAFPDVLKKKGVDVGIKVDTGLKNIPDHPEEQVTEGLEGLPERLKEYRKMGATFAKWRAVYTIGPNTPSEECMKLNAENFVQYALMCHAENIVPIIEPEVLFDGGYSLEDCYKATTRNLEVIFAELVAHGVFIPGVILKTSMVLPGKDSRLEMYSHEIAQMTVKCLKERVPDDVGGIVFLSGGQDDEKATINLSAMHKLGELPWPLTFSYGRAIQNEALKAWAKNPTDTATAQKLLVDAAKRNSLASIGQYEG